MEHVALTVRGRYLHLVEQDGRAVVRADAATIEPSGVLTRLPLGHDRVALRTVDGQYLTFRPEGDLTFGLVPEDGLSRDAAFEEILWPNGQVSLRSSELTFVSARTDGCVVANRTVTEVGERFAFVAVPIAMVPAQVRRRVAAAEEPVLRSGG